MVAGADIAGLTEFRRALHRAPDLSGEEAGTAAVVAERLLRLSPDRLETGVGGHGVIAEFRGREDGPAVLFRCELDGLPIAETGSMPWVSGSRGKAHLCGHDGHMAILAGFAGHVSRNRPARGRVICLFQPAEETGAGAAAVLADPRFAPFRPDHAYALHNMPGLALGEVRVFAGPFMFASEGIRFELGGRTSHASQPENAISPAAAMSELVTGLPGLPAALGYGTDDALATVVHARLGEEAYGITPGNAVVMATLRSLSDAVQKDLMDAARALAADAARRHGLSLSVSTGDRFAAVCNDSEAVQQVEAACAAAGIRLHRDGAPFRASEDFGLFGTVAKSALFFLGAGEGHAPLHAPDYDFPDALIAPGISVFARIAENLCGRMPLRQV